MSKESNNVDWFGFSHQNNCKILKVWLIFKVERVCMAKGSAKYWKSVSIHVKKQQSHRLCWWWHNYNAISRFQRELACAAPLETSHSLVLLSWLGLELWWPREMICVLSLPSRHVALEMSISRPYLSSQGSNPTHTDALLLSPNLNSPPISTVPPLEWLSKTSVPTTLATEIWYSDYERCPVCRLFH